MESGVQGYSVLGVLTVTRLWDDNWGGSPESIAAHTPGLASPTVQGRGTYSSVAQWIERRISNPIVAGSSPAGAARILSVSLPDLAGASAPVFFGAGE